MMYYKTIAGRQVFSDCKTLQLENDYPAINLMAGQYVSNPSAELIAAEGWLEYVPPVVPPAPLTEPEMAEIVAAVKRMLDPTTEALSDEDAIAVAALFPAWIEQIGKTVEVGQRFWYDEELYKVLQEHKVQADWTPDVATSLFTPVCVKEWPEWRQPTGAQDAYRLNDKVTHNGTHWQSNIDYNTYEPGVYGWEARP